MPAPLPTPGRSRRATIVGLALSAAALGAPAVPAAPASAATLTGVDLSTYVRVGRYNLPHPTRDTAPSGNLLAEEASGVVYNPDTDSLFVVGDGSTSVVQVSKTGQLIDAMTLPTGSSPQGTEFYDLEGIAYLGGGKFAFTEERDRKVVRFTYAAGTTLTRANAQTVPLGTPIGNVGLEGLSNDPTTGGILVAKEKDPLGLFSTTVDWAAGTASNGSASTVNSTNLFDPVLLGTTDVSDVYALSNVSTLTGPQSSNLLVISQEAGKVLNVSRSGVVSSSLTITGDVDNPLSVQAQTHEGVTIDNDGKIYTVSEEGGGSLSHPQLWVYAPSTGTNAAPTAISLTEKVSSLPENTATTTRVKIASVNLTDDGLGTNQLSVTGPDAASFDVDATGLYLKAGTALSHTTKPSYTVSVQVDDPSVGATPDAVSASHTLAVGQVSTPTLPSVKITEVTPWGSGDGAYTADWFEVTNTGAATIDLAGWKFDDSSATLGNAVALSGVGKLAPGQSALFLEGDTTKVDAFKTFWFPGGVPAGLQVGYYSGSGVGLSTGGDEVNLFDAGGTHVTGVAFGSATTGRSFDNGAGLGGTTAPRPIVSTLSTAGTAGAFTVGAETGSPGVTPVQTPLIVSEAAPWGSNAPYGGDWWELTNRSDRAIDLTGFKVDDSSNAFATALALQGVSTIAPGQSVIFIEGTAATAAAFTSAWFGSSIPAGFQIGFYSGAGIGLSGSGDAVNVFNADGDRVTGIAFGAQTDKFSFDNAAGAGSFTLPLPTVATLSVAGVNGAFFAHDETASPGAIAGAVPDGPLLEATTPTFPSQPAGTIGLGQWVTATNTGDANVPISRVKIVEGDDASAGDFLLGADRCSDETLAPNETCKVLVRFAPGRQNATSAASLVFTSNVPGAPVTVALSAASTGLPAGPKGDTGATGPKGDTGAAGAQGPAGKDGTFAFTATLAKASVRRGSTASIKIVTANRTTATVAAGRLTATGSPRLLRGTPSATLKTHAAGQQRTTTLKVKTNAATRPGTYTLKVRLTFGKTTVTRTVKLTVTR